MNMVVAKRKHLFESHRPHLFFELRQLSLSPVVRHCRSTVPNNNDTHTPIVFFSCTTIESCFLFLRIWIVIFCSVDESLCSKIRCLSCNAETTSISSKGYTAGHCARDLCVGVAIRPTVKQEGFPPFFFLFSFGQVRHEGPSAVDFFFFLWAALHRRPQSLFHLIHQTYV